MKNMFDFPLKSNLENDNLELNGMLQSSQVSDRQLIGVLLRDFGEEIVLVALERFKDREWARQALVTVLAEVVVNRQKYWGDRSLDQWIADIQGRVFRRIDRKILTEREEFQDIPKDTTWDRNELIESIEKAVHNQRRWRWIIQFVPIASVLGAMVFFLIRQLVQAYQSAQPQPMIRVLPVQTSTSHPTNLVIVLVCAGYILGMIMTYRILHRYKSGRFYTGLMGWAGMSLLFIWFMKVGFPYVDLLSICGTLFPVVIFTEIFSSYLWMNRRRWSLQMWLTVAGVAVVLFVVPFSPFLGSAREGYYFDPWLMIFFLGFGVLPVLIWSILELPGYWRILPSLLVGTWLVGLILWIPAMIAINIQYPAWLEAVVFVSGFLFPILGGVVLGRLIYTSFAKPILMRKYLLLRIGIGLLLFSSLVAAIWTSLISVGVGEIPQIFGIILLFLTLCGMLVSVMAIVLRLKGTSKWRSLALLLGGFVILIPVGIVSPGRTDAITVRRAEIVNQAIQQYHQEIGSYPASLEALTPGYLLLIPRPVTYLTQQWCYISGGDYYRLGYPYPGEWAPPGEVHLQEFNGGNLPAGKSECEKELYEWKLNMW